MKIKIGTLRNANKKSLYIWLTIPSTMLKIGHT